MNLRLGSESGGFGYITFDGTSGPVTLDSDPSSAIIVGDQFYGGMTVQNGASISHGGSLVLGNADGSNGALTIDGSGSALAVGGMFLVGLEGAGTISVTDGGSLTAQSSESSGVALQAAGGASLLAPADAGSFAVSLGAAATGNGTLTVSGTGSAMSIDGDLAVGDAGTGTVSVSLNATLTNQSATVGNQANSTGSVVVTDTGSLWHSDGDLTVGGSGSGSVTVQNGGTLQVDGNLVLGKEQNASGTLTVDGSDSRFTFGSGELTVGSSGSGTLNLQNGVLADLSGNEVTVGDESGSTGAVTVTDANTEFNTGNLTVGSAGTGTLSVQDGAVLHTTLDATLGEESGGKGTATVDSAIWNIDGTLTVGSSGTGEVDVEADGTVSVAGTDITLGENSGGKGTLVFNGGGAGVAFTGKTTAGDGGSGTIIIEGGAAVTMGALTLGEQSTASGKLTVDGTGGASSLQVGGDLTVAEQGSAMFSVTNGGSLVVDGDMKIADDAEGGNAVSATVDLASSLSVGGGLTVGSQAAGALTIDHGSSLAVEGETVLGEMDGGAGTLTVRNSGSANPSTFNYGGDLTVGKVGAGALAISGGGLVQPAAGSAGIISIASGSLSTGSVTVSGEQSQLVADTLIVGGGESGAGGQGSISLTSGGTASVASELLLWRQASVNVTGGSFTVGSNASPAAAGTLAVNAGGTLAGFGNITGTVVDAGGTIQPGGDPGTLQIDGDFDQQSGTLDFGIAGDQPGQYNQLLVNGDVTLDGTVVLDFQDGFAPAVGESFELIMGADSFTLSDGQILVEGLEPGWQYQLDLSGDSLTIDSLNNGVAVPEPSVLVLLACLPLAAQRRRRLASAAWPV